MMQSPPLLKIASACFVFAAVSFGVRAQNSSPDFPSRPIRLIVPYGPGGVTDVVARIVAEEAAKTLGQPIVIENKPGVNGTLGATLMVTTPPDGYTLSVVPIGIFRIPHIQATKFEPMRDLTFISTLAGYSYAIAVRSDSPFKTVKDLIDYDRQHPNAVSYGTPSTYSSQHLAMVELGHLAKVEWVHIPFKGDAESEQNLLAGNVQVIVASNSVLPLVQAGKVRLLVSLEDVKGVGPFADVPTLKSEGFNLAATSPYGIVGPQGMKPEVVAKLDAAFHKALDSEHFQAASKQYSVAPQYRNHLQYTEYAKATWISEGPLMKAVAEQEARNK